MKNKMLKFITAIMMFLFPAFVNADMSAPGTYDYEVVVKNPNGVKAKTFEDGNEVEITIPYETKLSVNWVVKEKGDTILGVSYNDKHVEIPEKDVMIFSKEIDFSKLQKNNYGRRYIVIKDVAMYNGPSTLYGEIENVTIPKDTQLDFEYCVDLDGLSWIYTEYKGTKGWVYVYTYYEKDIHTAIIDKEERTSFVARDLTIYKTLDNVVEYYLKDELHKIESVGTLKAGEILKYNTYTMIFGHTTAIYVTVNGVSGWIIDYDGTGPDATILAEESTGEVFVIKKEGISVYANYNDTTPVAGITIPYLTKIPYTYEIYLDYEYDYDYNVKYKITYKGKEYWMAGKNTDFCNYYHFNRTETIKLDTSLYKYSNKSETIDMPLIKQGEKVTYLGETYDYEEIENMGEHDYPKKNYYLVEYDGTIGWIHSDVVEKNDTTPGVTPEAPSTDEEEIKDSESTKKLSPTQIALICGGAAIVLAATSIVTIVLINKKKNNKKEVQPSDATIQHKELVKLLDRALDKEEKKK